MSIVLQSTGGGSVTIQEPNTASNVTATFPAATGNVMVTGAMPAFSAYPSSSIGFSSSTWSKVTFDTEEFDTNNNFASSRFTPTIAGYYQLNSIVGITGTSVTQFICAIYKNGAEYKRGVQLTYASGVSNSACAVSAVVYFNGSTDYVEIYSFAIGTSPIVNGGASTVNTSFNGAMIRSA